MVGTPVPPHVNVSIIGNVVYKPRDLVGMGLYHNLVGCLWIDNSDNGAVDVYRIILHIGLKVVQPDLLSRSVKSCRRGVVQILEKEFSALFIHVLL